MKYTNSKIIKNALENYKRSEYSELWQVYGKCSKDKYDAMECCKRLMHELNGSKMRIISHNPWTFSVGFQYVDSETGVLMFAYITRDYDRCTEWH